MTERSVDAISQIERGINSPSVDTLLRVSSALNVPPEVLLIGATVEEPERQTALAKALAVLHDLNDRDLSIAVKQLAAFTNL